MPIAQLQLNPFWYVDVLEFQQPQNGRERRFTVSECGLVFGARRARGFKKKQKTLHVQTISPTTTSRVCSEWPENSNKKKDDQLVAAVRMPTPC